MTPRLTAAGAADIDAVMDVMAVAFDPGFGEAWSAAQVLGSLAAGSAWLRLAQGPGAEPLGFTLCRLIRPEAELLLVGVAPAARRRGIGRALLAAAAADARERGATTLFLEVRDGNAAALALYRAAGYAGIGRRRDYYRGSSGVRFDAISLRLVLDDCRAPTGPTA
jgi:ribosomal-protein-alanine N-acetyltransferase